MTNSTLSSPPRTVREREAKETSVSTLQGKKKEAVEEEVAEQMVKTMPMSPERNAREPGAKDTAVKETSTRTVEMARKAREGTTRKVGGRLLHLNPSWPMDCQLALSRSQKP
jgi:hypothetical protein